MNLRDCAETLDGSAQIATARVGVTVTGPEEVIGVFGGQGLKGGLSVRVEEHLDQSEGPLADVARLGGGPRSRSGHMPQ